MSNKQTRHNIRRLAMQVLYQIDMTSSDKREDILSTLDQEHDSLEIGEQAVDLALEAWGVRADADQQITELAPDWPTYRQPPVDRAILRLGYYEITSERVPAAVAIDEAVELAKRYCGKDSSAFINGVLDKIATAHPPLVDF